MKWITRERARVDRIACPWLISPLHRPAAGVPVRPGHAGARRPASARAPSRTTSRTSSWGTTAPVLVRRLHRSLRAGRSGARARWRASCAAPTPTTAGSRRSPPGSTPRPPAFRRPAGTTSTTWRASSRCTTRSTRTAGRRRRRRRRTPRVLFVCLHGAAKSVVGAAHFRRLAAARGLAIDAVAAGTEPDPELAPGAVKGLAGDGLHAAPAGRARSRSTT